MTNLTLDAWPLIYRIPPLTEVEIDEFRPIEYSLLENDKVWQQFSNKTGWRYREGIRHTLSTDLDRRYYRNLVLGIIRDHNKWCAIILS